MIPYKSINIRDLNELAKGTLAEHLGMEVTDIGEDFLEMRMPVRSTNLQPFGMLHGGAVAALAENAGSLASYLVVGPEKAAAGTSLSCNHLKSSRSGYVIARAVPRHIGKSSHVWEIEIRNEEGQLTNLCVLTLAIIAMNK